ncbi:MAG: beta-N-acetylhexosaminidase [Trueperaceae bacterium]|nr:beta-N-acetylhexosaminidase [Trueperaceae bacterium]
MPLVLIDLEGPTLTPDERAVLANEPVAGLCLFARNVPDRARARDLVADARSAAGRPLLVTIDQEGGGVVRLTDGAIPPAAMALGAVDDVATTEAVAAATARSLRTIGVDVDFAPVADVALDPRNPVIADRAFGADPALVARHVAAFVRGLQEAGVAATLKHFPGHGDVAVDSHLDLPRLDVDRDRLERVEWVPFRAGIAAGAAAVMTAHLLVPALDPERPATMAPAAIAALRTALGFDGVVFSDALNMSAIADRWPAPEAAVRAVAAGVDAPLLCGSLDEHVAVLAALAAAEHDGRLDPAALAASRARLAHLAATYPPGPHPEDTETDRALMAAVARRAVVTFGTPPRLAPGATVAVLGAETVQASAATDVAARPTAALVDALREDGFTTRWVAGVAGPSALDDALRGAAALLVVTADRVPLTPDAVSAARGAFARATARGVPAVHVALWNPAHVAALPGPAIASFGFRADAVRAAIHALRTGEAPGRSPMPVKPWSEA